MSSVILSLVCISILPMLVKSNLEMEFIDEDGLFDWICSLASYKIPLTFHLSVHHITTHEIATHLGNQFEQKSKQYKNILHEIPVNASLETLKHSKLNSSLPFYIFTNGYNNYATFNKTWMYRIASVLAEHPQVLSANSPVKANYVFLSWHMESSTFDLDYIPSPFDYLTTMAYYEHIVRNIAQILESIVDLVEDEHKIWPTVEARSQFYSQFKFYGYSLGAHVIAHAVILVHKRRPSIKFGKVIGLDPAQQCFSSDSHGLSSSALDNSARQTQVIHTNIALLSHSSRRGQVEIILNGGTFQPKCSWYDLLCSHSRSTDIFTYFDSNCQMVAYRCSSLEHFKLGACEICDDNVGNLEKSRCVLVNLEGQYSESLHISVPKNTSQIRNYLNFTTNDILRDDKIEKDDQYYYVNTNPNFRSGIMTHCLQHYQMRLIIISDDLMKSNKCKLSMFTKVNSQEIQVRLVYTNTLGDKVVERNVSSDEAKSYITLTNIIDDTVLVYSGLKNFEGKPVLYESAVISGVDFESWSKCLTNLEFMSSYQIVFDLAFMSNTDPNIRQAYSSVLCGQWDPNEAQNKELSLELCKQSDLEYISKETINYLAGVDFNNQFNSWEVTLLNSLFSLFFGWKPLR